MRRLCLALHEQAGDDQRALASKKISPSDASESENASDSSAEFFRAIARAPEREEPPVAQVPDPTRIAHFQIEGRLGRGAMGIVFKATDSSLHRTVALKVLPLGFESEETHRSRFMREARAAAALNHPNLAAVYEIGGFDGRIYIAMEYVRGQTMRALLEKNRPSVAQALEMAKQIAAGLAHAHAAGIVHRDLKPDNVMVTGDGRVKVLDFGLAKLRANEHVDALTDTETEIGRVMGTPAYMAPEQARGETVTPAADIFAFGVMLHEMLTGARPFKGALVVEILRAIQNETAPLASSINRDVPAAVDALIADCLQKDPLARIADGGALDDRLSAILGAAASATTTGKDSTRSTPMRAQRLALFTLLGVAAIGGAILGVSRVSKNSPAPSEATSPIASASASVRVLTNGPPPSTTNAEAATLYVGALQKLRDGDSASARRDLFRAAALDPAFVEAHLAILCHADIRSLDAHRARAARVSALRAKLSERDLALFTLCENSNPKITAPAQIPAISAEAHAIAERYPRDADILLAAAWLLEWLGQHPDGEVLTQRAVDVDPKWPGPLQQLAYIRYEAGDVEGAIRSLDACLAVAPRAVDCLSSRLWWNAGLGRCHAVKADAQRIQELTPQSPRAAYWMARSLAAENAPIESIRESLNKASALSPSDGTGDATPSRTPAGDRDFLEATVAALTGDLASAEKYLRDEFERDSSATSDGDVVEDARLLVETALEAGDDAGAIRAAKRYLDTAPARQDNAGTAARPYLLSVLRRAHTISEDKFLAARSALVDNARPYWSPFQRSAAFYDVYASPASTPDEAREAIAALPTFAPLPQAPFYTPFPSGKRDGYADRALGTMYLLAGRVDDALPHLIRGAAACDILDTPVEQMRAHVSLGTALEQKGDVKGACDAYQFVTARWSHPKPRSISVDAARARIAALRCSPRE